MAAWVFLPIDRLFHGITSSADLGEFNLIIFVSSGYILIHFSHAAKEIAAKQSFIVFQCMAIKILFLLYSIVANKHERHRMHFTVRYRFIFNTSFPPSLTTLASFRPIVIHQACSGNMQQLSGDKSLIHQTAFTPTLQLTQQPLFGITNSRGGGVQPATYNVLHLPETLTSTDFHCP